MKKDEILSEIVVRQEKLGKLTVRKEELEVNHKEAKSQRDNLQTAYDHLVKQLDRTREFYGQVGTDLTSVVRASKFELGEIDRLKRELARLEDAERINADYLRQVEEFRSSLLSAPWRGENREDGFGAKEYQVDGAIHLAVAKQAILGDKRGLGKTLTSLIWADLMGASKIICVGPSDSMHNFAREVRMWAPHRNPVVIGRMPRGQRDILIRTLKLLPEFLVILNYEAWRKDSELIDSLVDLRADTFISDEAHRAKEWDTRTNQGIQAIRFGLNVCPGCDDPKPILQQPAPVGKGRDYYNCKSCGWVGFITEFCSVKNVLPMTGTPILNSPQEIFPLLRLIDPENFKDLNTFLSDFCIKMSNQRWRWQSGAEKELMEIIGPRFLARDRNSVGVDIPEAQIIRHEFSLQELKEDYPKQYAAYVQVRDHYQLIMDQASEKVMSIAFMIVVLMRLRQVLTWPAAIELKENVEIAPDEWEKQVVAQLNIHESLKVDKSEDLIRDLVKEGERVVVFSQFRGPLHELKRRLGEMAVVYDGSTSDYIRNQIQLDFDPKTVSQSPRWQVVLCNYKAAGEALNLNAASQMILVDREWNPGRESQAIGRIDRLGSTKPAQIHIMMVMDSVDTFMEQLIEGKASMIEGFEDTADMFRSVYDAIRNGMM